MNVNRGDRKLSGRINRLIFALALLSCNTSPLLAEDNSTEKSADSVPLKTIDQSQPINEAEPQTSDNKPEELLAAPAKKDLGEKTVHFATHLPQRLGLFTANVVVAAPVLFVRRTAHYTASNTKELIGDHKNPVLLVPAGVLSSYYGLTSGLVEGTTFGVINSWKHSADGHISKASLGLEDK